MTRRSSDDRRNSDESHAVRYRAPLSNTIDSVAAMQKTESNFSEDLTELSESEAESSYQELSQEQGVKHKQEESNDLKQFTGELTSDRDSLNAVRGGN